MATTWTLFAFYLLPTPVVIISLLLLPLPRPFHKGLLLFCKSVLSIPFLGLLRVEQFCMLLSGVTFGGISADYVRKYGKHAHDPDLTPNQKAGYYSGKWRMERNWWIACFSFFAWCVLARFHQVMLNRIKLQEKVDALEKSNTALQRTAQAASAEPRVSFSQGASSADVTGVEMASLKKNS